LRIKPTVTTFLAEHSSPARRRPPPARGPGGIAPRQRAQPQHARRAAPPV